jgi:hypothetical protein
MDGKGRYIDNIFVERLWRGGVASNTKLMLQLAQRCLGSTHYLGWCGFVNFRANAQGNATNGCIASSGANNGSFSSSEPILMVGANQLSVGGGHVPIGPMKYASRSADHIQTRHAAMRSR